MPNELLSSIKQIISLHTDPSQNSYSSYTVLLSQFPYEGDTLITLSVQNNQHVMVGM